MCYVSTVGYWTLKLFPVVFERSNWYAWRNLIHILPGLCLSYKHVPLSYLFWTELRSTSSMRTVIYLDWHMLILSYLMILIFLIIFFFILSHLLQGSNLDSYAKMWRLVADLMNDLGRFFHIHLFQKNKIKLCCHFLPSV